MKTRINRITHWLRILILGEEGMPWFFPVFGAVLLSVAANLTYDLLKEMGGLLAAVLGITVFLVLAGFIIAWFDWYRRKEKEKPDPRLADMPHPSKHKALIVLISRSETAIKAIDHHLPTLQHCWLITTPETTGLAGDLQKHYVSTESLKLFPRGIPDEYSTQRCYELVLDIRREALHFGLTPAEIIADITGGTKPMTTALVLACVAQRHEMPLHLQHVPTRFETIDGKRQPVGPLEPIEIIVGAN